VSRPVGRLTTVEAVDLAESARRLCSDVLRGVSTRVVVARPVRVRADERRATQVLVNLIRNAGQAMAGRDGATLELTIDRTADTGVLRVADNGPGLPPAVAAHLFELWVTSRPGGTGLGLALARRYLTEMGGSLTHVATGRGATFEVRLPVGRETTLPTLVPDISLSGVRILVVDDAELIRRSLGRALASIGEVVGAADAAQARAILAERRFDVILLDMNLPDDSGRRLFAEWPTAVTDRVVFLSGNYSPREQAWLEENGLRWAVKPVGAEQVRQLVLEVLDRD
jgi:CheY-like chemotaxis protein